MFLFKFITNENRIITLEMLIAKCEKRGKIELNIIKDKDDGLFTIRDITDKILDKFTEEREEN